MMSLCVFDGHDPEPERQILGSGGQIPVWIPTYSL